MVDFFLSGNSFPDLLNEFPDPKGLLNNTISRSLGVGDLSQYVQYSCTEHAGVKVRRKIVDLGGRFKKKEEILWKAKFKCSYFMQKATVRVLWPSKFEAEGRASKKIDAERFAAAAACLKLKVKCSRYTL